MRHRSSALAASIIGATIIGLPALRAMFPAIPTASYFALVTAMGMVGLVNLCSERRHEIPQLVWVYASLTTLLVVWLACTSLWTTSMDQYLTDLILLLAVVAVVGTGAIALSPAAVSRMPILVCLVGVATVAYIVADYVTIGDLSGYGSNLHEFYLTASSILGLGAVIAALEFLTNDRHRLRSGFLAAILLVGVALSLGRGALLSSLLLILVIGTLANLAEMVASGGRGPRLRPMVNIAMIFVAVSSTLLIALRIERTRDRLIRLISGTELESGGRGELWHNALRGIVDAPVKGHGLGANGVISAGFDEAYPHNLFLQVWIDGGFVATFLLSVIVAVPLLVAVHRVLSCRVRSRSSWIPLLGAYCFSVLEYAKSNNFYTAARTMFLLGLCVVWLLTERSEGAVGRTAVPLPSPEP
jgi:O-antigen ligase